MIANLAEAVAFYNQKILNNEGRVTKTFNGAKGPIAQRLTHEGSAYNHVVFYKKSWNEFFGRKFRRAEQRGQTCRLSIVIEAAAYGEVIGIVHPETDIYTCMAQDWLSYARKNGTIWIPTGEESEEASVPASMLSPAVVVSKGGVVTPPTGEDAEEAEVRWGEETMAIQDSDDDDDSNESKKKGSGSGLDAYF